MRKADWYFDFISPFAWFGFNRLRELPADLEITLRPVLFAALLDRWGQKGPAEIVPKRLWTFRWCLWQAQQYGIPFRIPAAHPFNPLPFLRLAIAGGCTPEVVRRIYEAIWTTGGDPMDSAMFNTLAAALGIDPARCNDAEVKDRLRRGTEDAAALGVFGVPTLLIDGEAFWGADAMDFAKAFLADPEILKTAEMQRVASLPVGVTRKGI